MKQQLNKTGGLTDYPQSLYGISILSFLGRGRGLTLFGVSVSLVLFLIGSVNGFAEPGRTIRVPQDKPGIQAAIDAADDGDIVLIDAGVYHEMITIDGKNITLASRFLDTEDPNDISRTVLKGSIRRKNGKRKKADFVIKITKQSGPNLKIIGFTIQNGDDGITCSGNAHILHNRFINNDDAIDYEDGGGVCQFNTFENNEDDAVDLDGASEVVIADNLIRDSKDDGIEIRLHRYSGPTLNIEIRNNIISGNGEDGIQIIDYPDISDRVIHVERNVIVGNAMAALGCMGDGNTKENYEGADIPERIYLVNNTIVDNEYGVTGGDNLIALNNIFAKIRKSGLKRVDGASIAAYNLFWENEIDFEQSRVDEEHIFRANPLLDKNFKLKLESPCIDAGTALFRRGTETLLQLPSSAYVGIAPDLGAFEAAGKK
ncbi:MAG: right-handed parallel beta-helix repeat-containing protein [Candidatus Poribacteria bacterium]